MYEEMAKKFDVPVAWLQEVIPYLNPCNDEAIARELKIHKMIKESIYYKLKYQPVETVYNGITFKSRTEARWGVFFDELDLEWTYTGLFHLLNKDFIINGKKKNTVSLFSTPDKSTYFDERFDTRKAKIKSKYHKF